MSNRSCEIRHGMQKKLTGNGYSILGSSTTTSLAKLEQKEESEATQDFSTLKKCFCYTDPTVSSLHNYLSRV